MATSYELRIVESTRGTEAGPAVRPISVPPRRPEPAAADVLESLRATPGAEALIEKLPGLGDAALWGKVGYYDIRKWNGPVAYPGLYVFGASYVATHPTITECLAADVGFFAAASGNYHYAQAPKLALGHVCCGALIENPGYYLFVALLETGTDDRGEFPVAQIEATIDDSVLGTVELTIDENKLFPFLTQLDAGLHQFWLRQVDNEFYFQNVTVWNVPGLE